MKISLKKSFFLAAAYAIALISAAAFASVDDDPLPSQLLPWKTQIESVLSHYSEINPTEGHWLESLAASKTNRQALLPTLSAGFNANRSRTDFYEGSEKKLASGPASEIQWSLTLRQNLFTGGTDLKKISLADLRQRLALLNLIQAKRSHIRSWLMDVAEILYQKKVVGFHNEAFQQAQALNALASRKEASGFLGRRDLLDSQRELLRVEQEMLNAQNLLNRLVEQHRRNFGFERPDQLNRNEFNIFTRMIPKRDSRIETSHRSADWVSKLLPNLISTLEKSIAEYDSDLASFKRFSPRVDFVAQASQSRQLAGSRPQDSSSMRLSDNSRALSLALMGEISLNPPVTFGAIDESLARISTARRNERRTLDNTALALESILLKLQQTERQKSGAEQLVSLTQQLRDKNQRLFEAGELPIDRLISSQQDLNRDRLSLAAVENDALKFAADWVLSEIWSLAPSSIPQMGAP